MTLKLTKQSFYWIVLGVIVVAFGAWIMKLQSDIQSLYDAIELNESLVVDVPAQHKKQN